MSRRLMPLVALAALASLLAWFLLDPTPTPTPIPTPASSTTTTPTPTPAPPPARPPPPAPVRPDRSPPPAEIPSPSPSLAELDALDVRLATFETLALDWEVPEGATQEEENQLAIQALKAHTAEAALLQKAYEDLIARHDDPRVEVLATIAIGDLKDALAVDLEESPSFSYFTEAQAELYRMGIEDKAHVQHTAAQEAWDRAAALASALPADPEIEALLAERRPSDD